MGRLSEHVRVRVVKTGEPKLSFPITYGDGGDERFVELGCDLLTAAMLVDFVRNEGRLEMTSVCRAYMKKGEGQWVKLPYDAVLCVQERGKWVLNENIFPIEIEAEAYNPGVVKRVLFKRKK